MGRILVADDDDAVREGIVMTIRSFYEHDDIDVVENGEDLVARAKADNYNLILTDNSMPGMTGLQAIPEIRKFSAVPIYLISAQELEEEAIAAGANGYVNKREAFVMIPEILSKHLH